MEIFNMQETLNLLFEKLSTQSKVCYVRFGDGDFSIMQGIGRCIEHEASPELQRELIESFSINDDNYLKGAMFDEPTFNGISLQPRNPNQVSDIRSFFEHQFNINDMKLYSHVLLTYMSVHQQDIFLYFLDEFIRPKKKLFIGSVDKKSMEKLVGEIDYYVQIPVAKVEEQKKFKGAYYSIDEWYPEVLKYIDDVDLVLPTAGMAGRVLCKRLWELDKQIHCIELGSIVDALINKPSRSWIKRAGNFIEPLIIKN